MGNKMGKINIRTEFGLKFHFYPDEKLVKKFWGGSFNNNLILKFKQKWVKNKDFDKIFLYLHGPPESQEYS